MLKSSITSPGGLTVISRSALLRYTLANPGTMKATFARFQVCPKRMKYWSMKYRRSR